VRTIVNSQPRSISVTLMGEEPLGRPHVSASCARLTEMTWWVSRVVVQPREARGHGLGSRALQLLLDAFRGEAWPGSELKVSPGGYDNNIEEQTHFYVKNGFVPEVAGSGGVLVFRLPRE
jgi:GNAT superfamily N-acetyltransferase